MGRGEKIASRHCRSVLRTADDHAHPAHNPAGELAMLVRRASVGSQARLGVNLRPLPPEGSASVVSQRLPMDLGEQQLAKICC